MSNEKSMPERECSFRLEVSGGFLLLISLTGFFCGAETLAAAALAAAVHELGHLILILWQGDLPSKLCLDVTGACLFCTGPEPTARQELLRAMAGPGIGLLLFLILRRSEADCLRSAGQMSLMLTLVNLLPAAGLDGDRMLNCMMPQILSPDRWERLSLWLGHMAALLTLTMGLFRSPQLFLYGLWLFLRQLRFSMRN